MLTLSLVCFSSRINLVYGQNRVINKNFSWKIRSIPNFDIYFYDEAGRALLPVAEKYLESAYKRGIEILPDPSEGAVPFFLYNNHNEFEQTNITSIGEGVGGVTEAYKNRFIVGNIGSQRYLEYVIAHEYIHELEYKYLFSGFWRSIKLIKFIFYPNWLMEGLAEYCSGDLDSTVREMYLRDAATCGKLIPLKQLHSFNHVLPHQITLAYKESEALIQYIADEYGKEKLPELLISYQERFDPDAVINHVIYTKFDRLDKIFIEYLEDKYSLLASELSEPEMYGKIITKHGEYPRFYESAVYSPDGKKIAYISDESGYRSIYIMDIESNKTVSLWDLNRTIKVENIHADGNGLSFSSDGTLLAFGGESKQKDYLFIYEFANKKLKRIETGTETVVSPVFSIKGDTIYFSGIKNGFRDLYSYNLSNKELVRLTDGPMDEIDAAISVDGRHLFFSAEKKNWAGRIEYDICRMDLSSREISVVTTMKGDERYPYISSDTSTLYFCSDNDGVNDIYTLNFLNNKIERLTRVIGGNFQPKVSPGGSKLMFSSFRKGEKHIYMAALASLQALPSSVEVFPQPVEAALQKNYLPDPPFRKYKFKASTDLFFPAIFYSSLDGLYAATYWQISDFLGNHQLQSQAAYSNGNENLNYGLSYGYLRYRTGFYFNLNGQRYFSDFEQTIRKTEYSESMVAVYPLNRFQRVEVLVGTIERCEEFFIGNTAMNFRHRENVAGVSLFSETLHGPYLEATSGYSFQLTGEISDEVAGGSYIYQNYLTRYRKYFPAGKEHVIVLGGFLGGSYGRDKGIFSLGGEDRVRGIPRNSTYAGHKALVTNFEWRFPIVSNINYHMWYIFPDFFYKTFYGALFVDTGFAWNEDSELEDFQFSLVKTGYGAGLRLNTFLMQSFPLMLKLQAARRADSDTTELYFSAGTSF